MNVVNLKHRLYKLTIVCLICFTYGLNAQEIAALSINKENKFYGAVLQDLPIYFPLNKRGFTRISSSFGLRNHPVLKKRKFHSGIDLAAKKGTPIYASANGKVIESGYSKHYGNYVIVQHKGAYKTLYGHMFRRAVAKNRIVKQGQIIGFVGSTGRSTGPHLHFEILKYNKNIDPYKYWVKTIKRHQKLVL